MRDKGLFRRWVTLSFAVVAFVGLGGVEGSWGQDGAGSAPLGPQGPKLIASGPCEVAASIVYSSSIGKAQDGNLQIGVFINYEQDQNLGADMAIIMILPEGCDLFENQGQQFVKCKYPDPEIGLKASFDGRMDQQTTTSVTGGFSIPIGGLGSGGGGNGQSWIKLMSMNTAAFIDEEMYQQGFLKAARVKKAAEVGEPILINEILQGTAKDSRGKDVSVTEYYDATIIKYLEFAQQFNKNQNSDIRWIKEKYSPDQKWDFEAQLRAVAMINGQLRNMRREAMEQELYNWQFKMPPLIPH